MIDARNSYSIVNILNRSSYACIICLKTIETPPIKLQCGCHIMVHSECIPSTCPNCKKKRCFPHKNQDKILAIAILTICGLICVMILVLVLKFGYKII
jgi:hypothetical protein